MFVSDYFGSHCSSGSVNALVRLKFVERTSWEDSIALQESLESEEFLGGTAASITECTADDGCE